MMKIQILILLWCLTLWMVGCQNAMVCKDVQANCLASCQDKVFNFECSAERPFEAKCQCLAGAQQPNGMSMASLSRLREMLNQMESPTGVIGIPAPPAPIPLPATLSPTAVQAIPAPPTPVPLPLAPAPTGVLGIPAPVVVPVTQPMPNGRVVVSDAAQDRKVVHISIPITFNKGFNGGVVVPGQPQVLGVPSPCTTPLEFISSRSDLSSFTQFVDLTGLTDLLSSRTDELTIFAPTNEGIENVINPTMRTLLLAQGNRDTLRDVVGQHIVQGTITIQGTQTLVRNSLEGAELRITISNNQGQVQLTQTNMAASAITVPNVQTCRSVVHIIDRLIA